MHVRQKEGNEYEFKTSGGIGLITSRLMFEGPMLNQSASYLVSGRSTFWDLITTNERNPVLSDNRSSFQDLNTKIKFNVNKNNKIYLSSYLGVDSNDFGLQRRQRWGNQVYTARWNNIVRDKHFMNTTAYFSRYRYRVINENNLAAFVGESKIEDAAMKFDMTSYVNNKHLMEYGASFIFHSMNPGQRIPGQGSFQNEIKLPREYGVEPSVYISSENQFSSKLTSSIGFRFSAFVNTGHIDQYIYDPAQPRSLNSVLDTLTSGSSGARSVYYNVLPRITLKYNLNKHSAIKLGYFKTVQYLHLLSSDITPSSEDIWKISDRNIRPTTADQITLGLYKYFTKADLNASLEVFYKKLDHTVEFKDAADLLFNENIETELLNGQERVYGMEVLMKKSFGRLTGWIGYTLSKAEQKVLSKFTSEAINDGEFFPSDFDRTHDIGITIVYDFGERLSASSNFVYYTGRPYSFPSARYEVEGVLVPDYTDRNQQRLASYNRLDLSVTWRNRRIKRSGRPKRYESNWVFSVYNVYNRQNTQSYFFTHSEENPSLPEIKRISVLGTVIPSITYNFRF